jgi:hypothetical protein
VGSLAKHCRYIFLQAASLLVVESLFIPIGCDTGSPVETLKPVIPKAHDTTSHNWVFDPPVILGKSPESSVLYDVAILNDSLVYAVGAVYTNDSSYGMPYKRFNLVAWDGKEWTLKRIPFIGSCSVVEVPPVWAICQVSPAIVLLSDGGTVVTYNGTTAQMDCRMNPLLVGGIEKMCASGPTNVFTVGPKGDIVHFDGTSWQKQASGTSVMLVDVAVSADARHVAAIGYSLNYVESALITSQGSSWTALWAGSIGSQPPPYAGQATSVYFADDSLVVACGTGVFIQAADQPVSTARLLIPVEQVPYRVRGTGANDIFAVGDKARILHYNGASWRLLYSQTDDQTLFSVAVTPHLLVAVGEERSSFPYRALVMIGRRSL